MMLAKAVFSQTLAFYVAPVLTDVNYDIFQDDHLVVRNTEFNNDKLFLFIGGTGTSTQNYLTISSYAGSLGFDVVGISYPNDVPAASLSNSFDVLAFDKFREELCYGTDVSPAVAIDSLNAINKRTANLILYLHETYPDQNWDQYLTEEDELNWSKIIVGGHSQGAGHAAYFAKFEEVERTLMFSGPNDYSDRYLAPANWLKAPGLTSMNRHFAYLSLFDEVIPFEKQLSNMEGLGLYPLYDTTHVDVTKVPFSSSRALYTTQDPGLLLNHSTTVKFSILNRLVWEYMLTENITTSLNELAEPNELKLYPNPSSTSMTVMSENVLHSKHYTIKNLEGQTIRQGNVQNEKSFSIDVSNLQRGIYFLNLDAQIYKFLKL